MKDLQNLMEFFQRTIRDHANVMNGNVGFGDGFSADNISGCWVTIPNTGAANVDVAVPHVLKTIPVGFLVMIPPVTGYINLGATAWTKSSIYIRCSAPNQALKVFVLGQSIVPS